jgi:predicted ATPase
MLKSIQLQNFYSFGKASEKIVLNLDTNLLVGINGSGKSNFLKAIQLLASSMSEGGSFQKTFNRWGGFDAVANFSDNNKRVEQITLTYEFDGRVVGSMNGQNSQYPGDPFYKIEVHRSGNNAYYLAESVFVEKPDAPPFYYLKMNNGRGLISERKGHGQIRLANIDANFQPVDYSSPEETFDGEELVLKQVTDPKRFYPLFLLKKAIEKIAVYSYLDTTSESGVRRMDEYRPETQLLPDGSNLTQFLQRLSVNSPLVFDKVIEQLIKINPFFKDIRFDLLGKHFALVLIEKHLNRPVTLDSLSDGTLRFLIMLSILYNPDRGRVICLDEPEISLHPDMIAVLSDVIRQSNSEGTQVIIATHSPMLLNMFDLDQVFVVEKDTQTNSTIIKIKSEEDFVGWVGEFLPGKLWLQGLLGGRR